MSHQVINTNKYAELKSMYKRHINSYIALYQLKPKNKEDLSSIYRMIKSDLIDSKMHAPEYIIQDILNIIPYNNRSAKSYIALAKYICDDYHVNEVANIPFISNYLFYKEFGRSLNTSMNFERIKVKNLDIHTEYSIYRAIMYDDKKAFISFINRDGFNEDQNLECKLYPPLDKKYSLLELCCYHGSVHCFKILISEFEQEITQICLCFSFLGGNLEIIDECLKHRKPDKLCMEYAIISHNIDFVIFLMNMYNLEIDLDCCGIYNNLDLFLAYFDQTNNFNKCFNYSTMFGIPSLCEYFISLGANINEKNDDGKTALHNATWRNCKEIAELLLSHNAIVNEKDKFGHTALHDAACRNCKEIAELLLFYGVNVNEKDDNEQTALHYAVSESNKGIVEILLSKGANINNTNKMGFTALHIANSKEKAELLLSHGANVHTKDEYGETALHNAARSNNKETAELLLSHGANINEKDKDEQTALHYAARFNSKETAELLLSRGANINEKDKDEQTALHYAARFNSIETAELLLSHGANVHEKDKNGETALHFAAFNNSKEITELLLLHGANVNQKDKYGSIALHIAACKNSRVTAELLLLYGSSINEKDEKGYTALEISEIYNSIETKELIISHQISIYIENMHEMFKLIEKF